MSSSDEEDTRAQESDDLSRMSMGLNKDGDESQSGGNYVTEFSKGMLTGSNLDNSANKSIFDQASTSGMNQFDLQTNESVAEAVASLEAQNEMEDRSSNNDSLLNRLSIVEIELADIEEKLRNQELQIASIENFALQQRLQTEINDLKILEQQKRKEHEEISAMMKN